MPAPYEVTPLAKRFDVRRQRVATVDSETTQIGASATRLNIVRSRGSAPVSPGNPVGAMADANKLLARTPYDRAATAGRYIPNLPIRVGAEITNI